MLSELPATLPTLGTECLIIGHAQKADVVWTRGEFMALCEHMLNGNDSNFFMIPHPSHGKQA